MKLQQVVEELQSLSRARKEAEIRLFRRCHEVEVSGVWKEAHTSFDGLLRSYDICEPSRYRDFLGAMKIREVASVVEVVGPGAAIQAAKISNPDRRAKYIEAAVQRREETGMPWSDQQAAEERLVIGGSEPRDSAWNRRKTERDVLREENAKLKSELREAQKTIREQAEELRRAKRLLEGTARKAAAKVAKS